MALTFVSRLCSTLTQLTTPTRFVTTGSQTHAVGNTLVALIQTRQGSGGPPPNPTSLITNTAGDLWVRTPLSPYQDHPGGIHHHETWYCLATKGAVNDVFTLQFSGAAPAEVTLTVYELAGGNNTIVFTGAEGSGGMGTDTRFGDQGAIGSSVMTITQPSVILANYRSVSSANPPVTPSGTQFNGAGGPSGTLFDSYQFTGVSGAATAAYTGHTDPQWSILAGVFALGPALPVGAGCPQDLPHPVGTGGAGCSADLANV